MEIDLPGIGQRLANYLDIKKIGVNKLGRMTETSGSQMSIILNGKNYGLDKLLKVFNALPDLNPEWILFGKGEMEKSAEGPGNFQIGDKNLIGNKNKQKNISGAGAGIAGAEYANVVELQQELKECQAAKDQLNKQLFEVQQELIQVLKGRG